jgi:hypothetical protein
MSIRVFKKKTVKLSVFLALLACARIKAAYIMLIKLTLVKNRSYFCQNSIFILYGVEEQVCLVSVWSLLGHHGLPTVVRRQRHHLQHGHHIQRSQRQHRSIPGHQHCRPRPTHCNFQ